MESFFGADEYLVYRNGQNIATTTETSYLDSGLFNGNQYCYFVVARNVTGDSGASVKHVLLLKATTIISTRRFGRNRSNW